MSSRSGATPSWGDGEPPAEGGAESTPRAGSIAVSADQRILEAAEQLFFERSFDGVAVDDIGRAAGMSGSAIYRHFPGKDAILAALFNRMLDDLLLTSGHRDDDPDAELDELLRAFAKLAISNERLAAIWVREQRSLAPDYRREHSRRLRRYSDRWAEVLGRCHPARTHEELTVASRGVQMLMLSEALRPPGARRTAATSELLLEMARASLATLAPSSREVEPATSS